MTRKNDQILGKGSFGVQRGVRILRIKGTPYELGYQHGYYCAEGISVMVTTVLEATAGYISAQTGWDPDISARMMREGMRLAEPYFPAPLREEMEGIADGARAAGIDIGLEEVMVWNTNYDQWCIYCHPHHWVPNGAPRSTGTGYAAPSGGGCSSFCAWDEWAGGDGRLIFGKNEDNFNMPGQLENRMLVVADPDDGYGHCFMTYPGMIGLDGGFNEAGFEMMTQLNSMSDETMAGCGIAVFTRLLLTSARTVDDAVDIFQKHPRCTGIAYHVADGWNRKAAVVETSSEHVSVRYPERGAKALWQTNHSNCYPGWMGYSGHSMVADQKRVNELGDIGTIEAWQQSLRDPDNLFVQAPSRFERYCQLIDHHKGAIGSETACRILSDCRDPYTGKERRKREPSVSNNILCTICALYPDMDFIAKEPLGPFRAHIANMWSLVSYPETGDFWLAINDFPAQYGGYEHFNLKALLSEGRSPSE